ncbi:hypothetical protein BDN72DRAFT_878357 [Pluteus cervinus]|uniref:Uncharacterized protein n=1 Tax=Pluteus cervinus TaxID=181527 RepID=A0ACD3AUA8_9AGAR|nr:hypothetical protein BDN72DRAFT_878357 [Pluteus cervinus]
MTPLFISFVEETPSLEPLSKQVVDAFVYVIWLSDCVLAIQLLVNVDGLEKFGWLKVCLYLNARAGLDQKEVMGTCVYYKTTPKKRPAPVITAPSSVYVKCQQHIANTLCPTPFIDNRVDKPLLFSFELPTPSQEPFSIVSSSILLFETSVSVLTILLGTMFMYMRVGAVPIDGGSAVLSSTIQTSVHPRCDCSGVDGRTIYDIVKSCFFTIAACVYRAVHQNIPDPELGFWGRLRVTMKVTFYALIAPELIIWWAMRQWFGARRVVQWMNFGRGFGEPRLNWTVVHGQFAQMGGFARKDDKRVLHPSTLSALLYEGQIDIDELRLTEKEIQDKSKGDILSKTLVAFQTTWFVFECIARLQQGLPLLELEVVTLAFATLNIITYALWWYKPLNVLCPIYIHVRPEVSDSPTNAEVASPREEAVGGGETNEAESTEGGSSEVPVEPLAASNAVAGMSSSGREAVVGETERTKKAESGEGFGKMLVGIVGRIVADIKKDIEEDGWLWMLWKRLIKEPFVAVVWPLLELLQDEEDHNEATHVSTFFAEGSGLDDLTWVHGLSSFIGIIFGAIHFLSWHSTFLTHIELLLWRTSSVALVVPPFFLLLQVLSIHTPLWRLERLFMYISYFVSPVPYILARFCVLVLAFLTLHDLPSGALTNVSWTSYIPHL